MDTEVLIIGGGTAGITTASRLVRKKYFNKISLIEPSDKHYYQPLWTLVGGGEVDKSDTERSEQSLIPEGVTWIKEKAADILGRKSLVITESGINIKYKYLIICPGLTLRWEKIKGLKESIGKNGVCSNYSFDYCDKTWEFIQNTTSGNMIFTHPSGPLKCAGAPQKIMWLAQDHMKRRGLLSQTQFHFYKSGDGIFGVQKYKEVLQEMVEQRNIHTHYFKDLIEIKAEQKIAVFKDNKTSEIEEIPYSFLHVTPYMSPPDFLHGNSLCNELGEVIVDKHTLQSPKYPNIFSLGDSSSLPTGKTGAGIRKQAPILVNNLINYDQGEPLTDKYNGYTSCPIVSGYGRLILAEFDYDGNPVESFPFNQAKERYSMYLMKKYLLPILYWKGMLKGLA
ncbi:MAG: NAD(P)/FAD-dependent oxidoreductase [Bacteriovoracaceae bacterium]